MMSRRAVICGGLAAVLPAGAATYPINSKHISRAAIEIAGARIADLRRRLSASRWPDEISGAGWDYGTNREFLQHLCEYWRSEFNWRRQEARLNEFSHYFTRIDGLNLHFVHEPGRGRNPVPLVLFHGWPSSFFQMYKLIRLLADPAAYGGRSEDSFDVIVPSLPGYGFSDKPKERGWTQRRFAHVFAKLITERLGCPRFFAHGGDIGAGVVNWLARDHSAKLSAIHLTNVTRPYLGPGSRPLTDAEGDLIRQEEQWSNEEGAYGDLQATKPQTISYGLNDSPIGLASYILEKWRSWSDCGGNLESVFTKDELLTNVNIYWFTESIASSMRVYFEHRRHPAPLGPGERIKAPAGFALFPRDLSNPPREWAERSYDVRSWSEMPRGGHFATLEQPELLANDLRQFFRQFR